MQSLSKGVVIPACPLALDAERRFDERHQVALFRYYGDAGAGGVAVGVHTTQFEIREPRFGLFEPLLRLASSELSAVSDRVGRDLIKISGVCGKTDQAVREASLAASLGYDIGLLSLAALKDATDDELIAHCSRIAEIIPIMGFYLQPAVGGRVLSYSFWRRFAEIENAIAIKISPFNRYQTFDVVRAVADAGREQPITLYTGNDDNIVMDLLTPYVFRTKEGFTTVRIKGGLLGQWSVWTRRAVQMLNDIHALVDRQSVVPAEWLTKNAELTDANGALFDVANRFAGCIAGINEVLRRQGLLASNCCLSEHERLSPGQADEIDRVCKAYPRLTDDDFVAEHLDMWLA